MMKVGIVTYHFANNFGAALQTYALAEAIKKQTGNEVEIVDYRHWFIRMTDNLRHFPISPNLKEIFSGLKTFSQRKRRKEKFNQFYREYYILSSTYNNYKSLKKNLPDCDFFICGSDQIWNPIVTLGVAPAYYLDFVNDNRKKISYAASIGVDNVREKYKKQMIEYINRLDAVSIREQSGIDLVSKYVEKEICLAIDPVFLLEETHYDKMAPEPIVHEEYILVYIMQNNDTVYEYVKKVKELLAIPVIAISRYGYKHSCVDKLYVDVGPKEFVNLFKYARFCCTNSFHGLAFSIIFKKNFFLIPSNRFNTRMKNLLTVLELEPPVEINEKTVSDAFYDTEIVHNCILKERKKAYEYLEKHLN